MAREDIVTIEVGGRLFDTWLSYEVDSDLLTPADQFRMTLGLVGSRAERDQLRTYLKSTQTAKVYVQRGRDTGRSLQMTGVIDHRVTKGDRSGGSTIEIQGRDLAAHLTDSCVPVGLVKTSGTNFLTLCNAATAPWSIPVVADHTASRDILTGRHLRLPGERLAREEARTFGIPPASYSRETRRRAEREGIPVDTAAGVTTSSRAQRRSANGLAVSDVQRLTAREAKPVAGETIWDFLERHAKRLGLMMWMTADGKLVVSSPNYEQQPVQRLARRLRSHEDDPNNILEGGEIDNAADRFSKVVVYGRTAGSDVERARVRSTLTDSTLPYVKQLIIHDNDIRSQAEADRRAKHELRRGAAEAQVLEYTLAGHGRGSFFYAIDTIVEVDDEECAIRGPFYVTQRTFKADRERGATTTLRLVPPGAIEL